MDCGRLQDLYRFYVPELSELLTEDDSLSLAQDQAHHALHVLRLAAGEEVIVFNGAGAWAQARLAGNARKALTVSLSSPVRVDAPPMPHLTLATAIPKGERADWLVEQASQLNVSRLQWLSCDRGIVKPRDSGGKLEKWRRLAIESARQCGRTHLLQVASPIDLEGLLSDPAHHQSAWLWLDPRHDPPRARPGPRPPRIVALVGPEGGWSPRENSLLRSADGRMESLRLTTTTLRVETACAAVAALIMCG